jgi:hypothetical protein
MAGEREHILDVLQALEARLTSSNRTTDAARIGVIRRAVLSNQHLDAALETLYGVRGMHEVALRLMWYAEKGRDPYASVPTGQTVSRRVDELLAILPADSPAPGDVVEEPMTIVEAVDAFGVALEAVKRGAYQDGKFAGVSDDLVGRLRAAARPLALTAGLQEDRDVARFAEAVGRFLDHARARSLTRDVRVVNLLDSANLTLQTVMQTHAAEDYDSLQEVTRLLENPLPLFEQPPAPEHE